MTRKTTLSIVSVLLLAVLAAGCIATQNISGRGSVQLVSSQLEDKLPVSGGEATFSLNFACYAQNNNRAEGYLNWNDPTNGITLKATLPETPVKDITLGKYTTCKAMKAAASTAGYSVNAAGIWNENGNADGDSGTLVGAVAIVVTQPGASLPSPIGTNPCAGTAGPTDLGTAVLVGAVSEQGPYYQAVGCLNRGKVTFGATQNQNQQ